MKNSLMTPSKNSPLAQVQRLKGDSSTPGRKDLAGALPLTSLIDAFSIIVIYLLIGTQSGMDTKVPSRLNLPIADSGVAVEAGSVVRIEKGRYFIDDKPVAAQQLGRALYDLKKRTTGEAQILVQADRAMTYANLDPLLRASSEAGLQKLKFAVMPSK